MTRARATRGLPAIVVLALAVLVGLSGTTSAQDAGEAVITGRVEHGLMDPDFDPTQVSVTLNVLEGITSFDQVSESPGPDGSFSFTVANAPSRTYFLGVEYQGARYSETRSSQTVNDPIVIRLFDTTNDTSVLAFESYTVIITGAVRDEGWVEILERASVRNDSGLTLIPNQSESGPAMLSFLRFALPPNAYNLDVRTNLVGGDVIEVDRGFALTTPITPTGGTPHLFEFIYRLDYDDELLDLSRTMRFGAESFRFVTPDDTAFPIAPQLQDLGATELNGRLLRLLEGEGIQPGDIVALALADLPQPTIWTRFRRAAGDWYITFIVPAVVIAALAGLMGYAVRRRRVAVSLGPAADLDGQRLRVLDRVVELEERHRDGSVSDRRYESERADLKQALMDLSVHAHMEREELE